MQFYSFILSVFPFTFSLYKFSTYVCVMCSCDMCFLSSLCSFSIFLLHMHPMAVFYSLCSVYSPFLLHPCHLHAPAHTMYGLISLYSFTSLVTGPKAWRRKTCLIFSHKSSRTILAIFNDLMTTLTLLLQLTRNTCTTQIWMSNTTMTLWDNGLINLSLNSDTVPMEF